MRKGLLLALFVLSGILALGQEVKRNEFAITYSPVSNDDLYALLIKTIGPIFVEDFDSYASGALSAEYFRSLGNMTAVGGIFSYYEFDTDTDGEKEHYESFSFLLAAKLRWYRRRWFGAYSKFGAGITWSEWDEEKPRKFNFQASLLGLEVGPAPFRAFVEMGAGEQGFLVGGLRLSFGRKKEDPDLF